MVDVSQFIKSPGFTFVLMMKNNLGVYSHQFPLSKKELIGMKSKVTRVQLGSSGKVLVFVD